MRVLGPQIGRPSKEGKEGKEGIEGEDVERLLESDLFLFQYTTPEGGPFKGISNWFISAHSNNKVLMTLRDMLMAYWRDYDCTLDYYIFHLFFWGMVKAYPKEIAGMPYAYSGDALLLMNHWGEEYDELKWKLLTSKSCFHKLSARPKKTMTDNASGPYGRSYDVCRRNFQGVQHRRVAYSYPGIL